jgi:hypothetical protein
MTVYVGQPVSEAVGGACQIVSSGKTGLDTYQVAMGTAKTGVEQPSVVKSGSATSLAFNEVGVGLMPTIKPPTPAFVPTPSYQPTYGQT